MYFVRLMLTLFIQQCKLVNVFVSVGKLGFSMC